MDNPMDMIQTVVKLIVSAVLIVTIAEVAKRTALLGALLASLPLTSLLAMIWLYVDTGDTTRVADLASGIFWLVLPSLALFLVLPALLRLGYSFWAALGMGCVATIASYVAELGVFRMLGIRLN